MRLRDARLSRAGCYCLLCTGCVLLRQSDVPENELADALLPPLDHEILNSRLQCLSTAALAALSSIKIMRKFFTPIDMLIAFTDLCIRNILDTDVSDKRAILQDIPPM